MCWPAHGRFKECDLHWSGPSVCDSYIRALFSYLFKCGTSWKAGEWNNVVKWLFDHTNNQALGRICLLNKYPICKILAFLKVCLLSECLVPKPSKKTQNQLSPNQTAAWLNNASDRGTDHISQINPTFLLGMRGNVGLNGPGLLHMGPSAVR